VLSVGRRLRLRHVEAAAAEAASPPGRVLDVGCGDGLLAARLAGRWPQSRVTGLDPDAEALARARRHAPPNVELVAGGAPSTDVPGTFDLIVSTDVLEHVRDDAAAVAWMAERLAKDGRLILHVPAAGQRHVVRAVARAMERELASGHGPHVREGYTPDGIRDLLASAGLSSLVLQTFHRWPARAAADIDTWTYLWGAKPLKAALLPLLLGVGALERSPSATGPGNGLLVTARHA
jgi:trans-aconitate 2-methyltransferase